MRVCSHNHEEVVYDSWNCPFCAYIEEVESTALDIGAEHHVAIDSLTEERDYYLDLLKTHNPELLI